MRVIQFKNIEDCFDGSRIKELVLDEKISHDFIMKLGHGCNLDYFPDFPRPFFRIEKKHQYQIKGVENNQTLQVIFYRDSEPQCLENLIQSIHQVINNG